MSIRYDSLLVRALASELNARFAGHVLRGIRMDAARRSILLAFHADSLRFDLDPATTGSTWSPETAARTESIVPAGCRIRAVSAPPDERVLIFQLEAGAETPATETDWRLIIELMTNQLNATVVDDTGRIRAVLVPRSGLRRSLTNGAAYVPPRPGSRRGAREPLDRDDFAHVLADVLPSERVRALTANVAYTSPINSAAILGVAIVDASPANLADAHRRYLDLVTAGAGSACVLRLESGPQPYPVALPGVRAEPHPDLLTAFTRAKAEAETTARVQRAGPSAGPLTGTVPDPALAARQRRRDSLRTRIERMRADLAAAPADAELLRRRADLLLAQLHRVRRGESSTELDDFVGGSIRVELDPAIGPAANAARLYARAKRRARAARRLPALIARAELEVDRLDRLDSERDDASTRTAPQLPSTTRRGRPRPYRRYRTSDGLEVRVGRGARANDVLTLRHARPEDIWMHARGVAGAHVVLRWHDRDANPPAAALREAATLAALHSKARTSGTVAVDWTRRKYVRKPRKAPPGQVTIERVRTIFVEPDERLEKKLRFHEH